jgi:Icc protein
MWLPGNHDDNSVMAEVNGGEAFEGYKILGNWLIVMADSTIYRQVGGYVEADEIDRIVALAKRYADKHVLVAFHHPPLQIDCAWLDPQRIKNGEEFLSSLSTCSNIKLLLCGHVHQEWSADFNGIPILSTPSTCIQFKPLCYDFTLDTLAPGYRWVDLHADGSFYTEVSRVVGADLTIDFDSSGY